MEKVVTVEDAPNRIVDLVHDVRDSGDHIVVEEDGVPVAAVVPIWLYAQWKRRRESLVETMADHAATSSKLVQNDSLESVQQRQRGNLTEQERAEILEQLKELEERIAAQNQGVSEEESIEFAVKLSRELIDNMAERGEIVFERDLKR